MLEPEPRIAEIERRLALASARAGQLRQIVGEPRVPSLFPARPLKETVGKLLRR